MTAETPKEFKTLALWTGGFALVGVAVMAWLIRKESR